MKSSELLSSLTAETERQTRLVQEQLSGHLLTTLNQHPAPGKWSVLECLAHLNSYAAYYLPQFEQAIANGKTRTGDPDVVTTWLGRQCVQTVHPDTIGKKWKAISRHNHAGKALNVSEISTFLGNQQRLLNILHLAGTCDLNRAFVRIEILKLLRLNLGEFFRFFVMHQSRHLLQAQRVLQTIQTEQTEAVPA